MGDGAGRMRQGPRFVPYLALGHIYPGDVALLPDQLAQQVAVPATAAAQVQDPAR